MEKYSTNECKNPQFLRKIRREDKAVDVKTFATLLARELVKRGIPRELAVKHSVSLVRTFDEEDLREISSYTSANEFSDLAESLAGLIMDREQMKKSSKEKLSPPPESVPAPAKVKNPSATAVFDLPSKKGEGKAAGIPDTRTRAVPVIKGGEPVQSAAENMKTKAYKLETAGPEAVTQTFAGIKTSDITLKSGASDVTEVNIPVIKSAYAESEEQEIYLDEEGYDDEKVTLTKRGRGFFIGIVLGTLPVTLIIALAVLGVFVLGIIAVCALVVAALLLVLAEAVAGSGLTLVGVIYGAIEIISGNIGVGIYEIGLGVCCGAIFLALGILTYNFATLVLPYILKQLISFEGYCLRRVGAMIDRLKKECNRL